MKATINRVGQYYEVKLDRDDGPEITIVCKSVHRAGVLADGRPALVLEPLDQVVVVEDVVDNTGSVMDESWEVSRMR